jgi:hypothetical protein
MSEISPSASGVKKVDVMKVAGLALCPANLMSPPPHPAQAPPGFTVPPPSLLEVRCFKKVFITFPPASDPQSCPIKLYVLDKDNIPISYLRVLSSREIAVHVLECEFITKDV